MELCFENNFEIYLKRPPKCFKKLKTYINGIKFLPLSEKVGLQLVIGPLPC